MPKVKVEENKHNPLFDAIRRIELENPEIVDQDDRYKIVDIMEFCNGKQYLDIPGNGLKLFPGQSVILKAFYKGTTGNEDIKLDQEEWEWLYARQEDVEIDGVTYERNLRDVIKKIHEKEKDETYKPFTQLVLVLGRRGTKCHEENQIISTTEGSITFRELMERKLDGEKIGICTYDPLTLKRSITYDIQLEENGVVECFSLETKRGIREVASWNHPYLVWRDNWDKPQFVKMSELMDGDRIAVAECTELFGKGGIGVDKAALLGHLQGDGGTTNSIVYSTACPVMLGDLKRIVNKEFPKYIVKYKSQYDYAVVKETGRFKMNGSQKNEIKEWLVGEGCFGKKAIEKEIPSCIYRGSKDEVSAFLSRLYGCDGWISCGNASATRSEPKPEIGYCSSSEKMAYGVRHLLQKFGIHAVVRESIAKNGEKQFKTWKVIISRRDCIDIFAKEINVFSKEKKVLNVLQIANSKTDSNSLFDGLPKGIWKYINSEIKNRGLKRGDLIDRTSIHERIKTQYSPKRKKVSCYGKNINDSFLIAMGDSDVKWDVVKSVSEVGERSTIAIEVKGTNIIGGDIISHNTFMASIITAYEAYKLILINNGDPHRYYNLPNDDEIAIINVALSQKQAGRLFGQVQSRLRNSPFFKGRIAKETSDTIRLYTDRDLQKKSEGAILSIQGSILLLCGHSNPDSLAGYSAILLLFDEIAFYDETGKVTGKYFVNRLKPSLSKFYKYNAGKVVMISSPNVKNGAFYDAFNEATDSDKNISDSCLSFQLPTWDINLDVSYSEPELAKERNANPEMFKIEFGGQWAEGGSYTNYFDAGAVDRCIKYELGPHQRPNPRCNYYIHVDPAKKSNNYAAIMVAKERYTTPLGKKRNKCSLAGIWVWKPTPGLGLLFDEIDNYIIQICSRFHPMSVTYDDYHSVHSVQRLRGHGINCTQISFNDRVKCKVYQNLNNMMLYQPEPEILLYDNCPETTLLIAELKELKIKRTKRGYSIMPDKHGDIASDDLSDCLAGACSAANEGLRMALPGPVTVRLGSHW